MRLPLIGAVHLPSLLLGVLLMWFVVPFIMGQIASRRSGSPTPAV
jgi:hypothetical protein